MRLKKTIVVSVITDLVSDQRVHKVCTFLHNKNFEVHLIGRETKNSLPLQQQVYQTERLYCFFNKGVLMYAEFMLRLFFKLFRKADILLSNDLDTLLPNFIHAYFKKVPLIYDSHEFFTGVPELDDSPRKKKIWQLLERFLLARTDKAYTVSNSIAAIYKATYNVHMEVVRNLPRVKREEENIDYTNPFPSGKFLILMQGAGINKGRGGEELVQAMSLLPPHFHLVLIGSGTSWLDLKKLVEDLELGNQVTFIEKVPFNQLYYYTRQANVGVSLDKPLSLNYELSLPNKIFDYIHAAVPVLSSSVKEVKKIIDHYDIGITIDEISPGKIADTLVGIHANTTAYNQWKRNTYRAARELCWEEEEKKLDRIYLSYY